MQKIGFEWTIQSNQFLWYLAFTIISHGFPALGTGCLFFCAWHHRQPKLAVCVLEDFIDSLNISLINEQVEMKTQIKKRVNKTFLTFYLLLLDVY